MAVKHFHNASLLFSHKQVPLEPIGRCNIMMLSPTHFRHISHFLFSCAMNKIIACMVVLERVILETILFFSTQRYISKSPFIIIVFHPPPAYYILHFKTFNVLINVSQNTLVICLSFIMQPPTSRACAFSLTYHLHIIFLYILIFHSQHLIFYR